MIARLKTLCFTGLFFALFAASASVTNAEDAADPLTANISAAFLTDYMFRGFNLYDGTSIQPNVALTYDMGNMGSIGGSVWAHFSAEGGESAAEKFTEVDYTLRWDKSFGALSVGAGHLWYSYPRDSDDIEDTAEFFVTASYDTMLSPIVSVYRDYDLYDATYLELILSHTLEIASLGDGFAITPFINLGFADDSEKVYSDDGFVQATFGISMETKLGDVTIIPSLNVTRESDDLATNEFWVGTTFSYDI